jgi:hypothetical protein
MMLLVTRGFFWYAGAIFFVLLAVFPLLFWALLRPWL